MFVLGATSRQRLTGVHTDLVRVVERAIEITECDFKVLEGLRTIERQKKLYAQGATRTMRSRHLTGHAVDLGAWVNGQVSWSWQYYYMIDEAMQTAGKELGIPIEWGGRWRTFKDGPHHQLPRSKYP